MHFGSVWSCFFLWQQELPCIWLLLFSHAIAAAISALAFMLGATQHCSSAGVHSCIVGGCMRLLHSFQLEPRAHLQDVW